MLLAGMGKRREARERAVQFLFQYDLNPPEDLAQCLTSFWESQRAAVLADDKGPAKWGQAIELPPPTTEELAMREFADPLIRGALEHREEIDQCIKKCVQNWDLPRIAAVDRNILRLAIYEMLYREDRRDRRNRIAFARLLSRCQLSQTPERIRKISKRAATAH